MARKTKKTASIPGKKAGKPPRPDIGLDDKDRERIRTALRQVWSWSYSRKLCIQRATDKQGFGRCEEPKCKKRVPKVYADHIRAVGEVDAGIISRMFVPSQWLQALCRSCHAKKTRADKVARDFAKAMR